MGSISDMGPFLDSFDNLYPIRQFISKIIYRNVLYPITEHNKL
jgi:hypothetical protein